jgi:hypothetical protein
MKRHKASDFGGDGYCPKCGTSYSSFEKHGAKCGPQPYDKVLSAKEMAPKQTYPSWECGNKNCRKRIAPIPGSLPDDRELRIHCPHCDDIHNYRRDGIRRRKYAG